LFALLLVFLNLYFRDLITLLAAFSLDGPAYPFDDFVKGIMLRVSHVPAALKIPFSRQGPVLSISEMEDWSHMHRQEGKPLRPSPVQI
jgi:hypothetical protein